MAIVRVGEIWARQLSADAETGIRTYARAFRVVTDGNHPGPIQALIASGLPGFWTFYTNRSGTEWDLGATLRKYDVDQEGDDPRVWIATASYSSERSASRAIDTVGQDTATASGEQRGNASERDPLSDPPEISFDFVRYQKPIFSADFIDDNGVNQGDFPITSSAGEPFANAVEMDETRPILRITRSLLTFDPAVAMQLQDVVNSELFFGAEARTAKLNVTRANLVFGRELLYWRVSYEIEFRHDTWDFFIVDEGTYELDDNGKPQKLRDERDFSHAGSALLDGDEHFLARNDPRKVVYRHYRKYRELDFNTLNLI